MSKLKLNLAQAPDLFTIQNKLVNAKPTSFGDAVRLAVRNNETWKAIKMIKEQIALGHEQSMEWCVGASTLKLINKLT